MPSLSNCVHTAQHRECQLLSENKTAGCSVIIQRLVKLHVVYQYHSQTKGSQALQKSDQQLIKK